MTEFTRRARWHGALVVALFTALLAVTLGIPALFFLAVVALGFVLVGQASSVPDLGAENETGRLDADTTADADSPPETDVDSDLRLERAVEDSRVRPGQSVTVTLSVTNEGSTVASDVRVVDEPPEEVPVTGGSPAFATAVRPGETVSHEYDLEPPRGEHEFGTATVRCRSLSATAVATAEYDLGGDDSFTCETLLDSFPLQDRTIQFVGQTPTDDGGSGVEFFATREYRRGDPMNRIDWHRFARTGDLATVEYREERAVTIVFVIDDRANVHRRTSDGGPDSYDLTLYAASRGVVASIEDGNRTGLAMLTGETWIEPGAGDAVRSQVADAISDAAGGSGREPQTGSKSESGTFSESTAGRPVADGGDRSDGGTLAVDLERRLPQRAQVVLCTPLFDRAAVDIVETLRTRGRAVTVVSPDVTADIESSSATTGARIAGLQRANRIDALRGLGATVVDWQRKDPLSVELARAFRAGPGGRGGGPA
ncbi:DUF58 domain-containing protein [Natrinema halophilum]|uniref:DUF58 domain-containing protein n=1 Tax=Natrinema halophilum TaxID=1699371 RepID=A0A7D5L3F2_9EURY|nr:DUF58 domain-containing protein [Natrinema halophilum]QLG49485.1 DUF58 domain-containing protein [Natrinema halophilum]